MSLIIKESERPAFQLPSDKTHQAVCYNVWNLGWQKVTFKGHSKAQHKIRIGWELNEQVREGKFAGKRLTISKRYTASLFERSALYKDLIAWRGRSFSPDELDGFDLENLIGANCLMAIVHNQKQDKEYANISAIIHLPDGITSMEPENPRMTPDWIRNEIENKLTEEEAKGLNEVQSNGEDE